jgi:hypothetical protein
MFESVPGGKRRWAGEGITENTWPGLRITAGPPNPRHPVGWTTVSGLMETGDPLESWVEVRGEEDGCARVCATLTGARLGS